MSILTYGRLRSRRYVRVELKKGIMGWEFGRGMYKRAQGCLHRKTALYGQPHKYQAICGNWAYLSVECVQVKHRGCGKTYLELI